MANGEEIGETWHLVPQLGRCGPALEIFFLLSRMAMKSEFLRAQTALVIKTGLTWE